MKPNQKCAELLLLLEAKSCIVLLRTPRPVFLVRKTTRARSWLPRGFRHMFLVRCYARTLEPWNVAWAGSRCLTSSRKEQPSSKLLYWAPGKVIQVDGGMALSLQRGEQQIMQRNNVKHLGKGRRRRDIRRTRRTTNQWVHASIDLIKQNM